MGDVLMGLTVALGALGITIGMISLRVFGACVNVQWLHDAFCVQQHARHSGGDDARGRRPRAPSCGAHGVCAHGDARVQQDVRACDVRDVCCA